MTSCVRLAQSVGLCLGQTPIKAASQLPSDHLQVKFDAFKEKLCQIMQNSAVARFAARS